MNRANTPPWIAYHLVGEVEIQKHKHSTKWCVLTRVWTWCSLSKEEGQLTPNWTRSGQQLSQRHSAAEGLSSRRQDEGLDAWRARDTMDNGIPAQDIGSVKHLNYNALRVAGGMGWGWEWQAGSGRARGGLGHVNPCVQILSWFGFPLPGPFCN